MKLTKQGISWEKGDDKIILLWPWAKSAFGTWFFSHKLNRGFDRFSGPGNYWELRGRLGFSDPNLKLSSTSMQGLISDYIKYNFRFDIVIAFYSINLAGKAPTFWNGLSSRSVHFTKDCVIVVCKDINQAEDILNSTEKFFANAILFNQGTYVGSNL